jgi:hypothetical protein
VVVHLGTTRLTQSFDSGLHQGATHKFEMDLDIPENLDRVDATIVQVDLVWHRVVHFSQQV